MPIPMRRTLYGLLAVLGFIMMVPLMVSVRRLQAETLADPFTVGTALDPAVAAELQSLMFVFLAGMVVATGFLYAALSAGYPRAWRPRENGVPRCVRCGAALGFGLPRCPACDQHLVW